MDIKITEDLRDYLYSRLPQIYRTEDAKNNYFLYEYLYILVKGGYNKLINSQYRTEYVKQYDELGNLIVETVDGKEIPKYKELKILDGLGISDFATLFDPLTCPEAIFKKVYESFGLKYFDDINISFQRRFLQNIGYMNRIKGSLVETRFICSVLTGMENEARYEKDDETGNRYLIVTLFARSIDDIENVETEAYIVEQFLRTRIPFYLIPHISIQILGYYATETLHHIEKIALRKGYTLKEMQGG